MQTVDGAGCDDRTGRVPFSRWFCPTCGRFLAEEVVRSWDESDPIQHGGDPMSGTYVREYYKVPAHYGDRVIIDGHRGVITGFDQQYLLVQFDGETLSVPAHPTWHVTYLTGQAVDR